MDSIELRIAQAHLEKAKIICSANQRHYERLAHIHDQTPAAISEDELAESLAKWKEAQQNVGVFQSELEQVIERREKRQAAKVQFRSPS